MGHDIGKEKSTYINMPPSDFRQLYSELEKHLCISKTSLEELAEKGNPTITESAFNDLAQRVTELTVENVQTKAELDEMKKALSAIQELMKKE